MAFTLAGYVFDDVGNGINGATVKLIPNGSSTPDATTSTVNDANGQAGYWTFVTAADKLYNVEVDYQGHVRRFFGPTAVQFNQLTIGVRAFTVQADGTTLLNNPLVVPDNSALNSPVLELQGAYDSNPAGGAVTDTREWMGLRTSVVPTTGAYRLSFLNMTGTEVGWLDSAGNSGLSLPASYNWLTNPGCEIWQRGNGPFTISGATTADRWQAITTGTATVSISRDAVNIDPQGGTQYAAAVTGTVGTGGAYGLLQVLENWRLLLNSTLSFQARVKSSVAGTYVQLDLGVAGFATSNLHPGDGAWHTLFLDGFTVPNTATKINVIVANNANNGTFYLDNCTVTAGVAHQPFSPERFSDLVTSCLWYYEITDAFMEVRSNGAGSFYGTTIYWEAKSDTPTVTLTSLTTSNMAATYPQLVAPSLNGTNCQFILKANLTNTDTYAYSPVTVDAG